MSCNPLCVLVWNVLIEFQNMTMIASEQVIVFTCRPRTRRLGEIRRPSILHNTSNDSTWVQIIMHSGSTFLRSEYNSTTEAAPLWLKIICSSRYFTPIWESTSCSTIATHICMPLVSRTSKGFVQHFKRPAGTAVTPPPLSGLHTKGSPPATYGQIESVNNKQLQMPSTRQCTSVKTHHTHQQGVFM